ncbi:hypothetical protein Scep_027356 [Stephania cephalantha]|uniref:Uncharacterized protein n=1 Tax=Stephania cephalantha TaxID=152367 RepID=A0AAP0HIF7_9MAGN
MAAAATSEQPMSDGASDGKIAPVCWRRTAAWARRRWWSQRMAAGSSGDGDADTARHGGTQQAADRCCGGR